MLLSWHRTRGRQAGWMGGRQKAIRFAGLQAGRRAGVCARERFGAAIWGVHAPASPAPSTPIPSFFALAHLAHQHPAWNTLPFFTPFLALSRLPCSCTCMFPYTGVLTTPNGSCLHFLDGAASLWVLSDSGVRCFPAEKKNYSRTRVHARAHTHTQTHRHTP
jgi:hypothetical protein